MKNMLTSLEKPINEINVALCEKLTIEEDKQDNMMGYYENSLERLIWMHQRVGLLSQKQLKGQI